MFGGKKSGDRDAAPAVGAASPVPQQDGDSAPSESQAAEHGADCLVVGRGLSFNGVIEAADHLLVEGSVAADLRACERIEIAAGGSFRGSARVTEAEIAGLCEGNLTVAGHLRIRAGGEARGRIAYGSVEIEPGGLLFGTIESAAKPRPIHSGKVVPFRPAVHDGD